MKPTQPQGQRARCWMWDAVALPEPLFPALSPGHCSAETRRQHLCSSHSNQRGARLEVDPKRTRPLMQELIDRKINQLPPPLMVMRSCLSGGLRGQRLPVRDSPGHYCHLAAAALKLRLGPPPNQKLAQYNHNELIIITPARC